MVSIAFLIACFNIFLAVLMLIYNWKLNKNILFFSIFMIIVAFQSILFDIVINGGSARLLMLLNSNSGPMLFLAGPMLYLFIRGLVYDENQFRDKDLLHLIPFFVNMVLLIPYLFKPIEYKLEIANAAIQNIDAYMHQRLIFIPAWMGGVLRVLSIIAYIFASLRIIYSVFRNKKQFSDKNTIRAFTSNFRWLNLIAIVSLILTVVPLCSIILYKIIPDFRNSFDTNLFFNITVLLHAILSLIILMNPRILYGLPTKDKLRPLLERGNANGKQVSHSMLVAADEAKTYSDYFDGLSEKIIAFIENGRPYLNPDFKANDLIKVFEVPPHHIQFCIRYYIQKDFKKLMNEYRIKYILSAFRSAVDTEPETLRMIISEAGFKTNYDYRRSFIKYLGQTPEDWIKSNI
jgi:AraC-like DNA-binding protein